MFRLESDGPIGQRIVYLLTVLLKLSRETLEACTCTYRCTCIPIKHIGFGITLLLLGGAIII